MTLAFLPKITAGICIVVLGNMSVSPGGGMRVRVHVSVYFVFFSLVFFVVKWQDSERVSF
jgi:hypothetical protein